jgi:hypothetical protein
MGMDLQDPGPDTRWHVIPKTQGNVRCGPPAGRGEWRWPWGEGAAPAPPLAAEGTSSIRVPQKNARCPGLWALGAVPEGLGGMAELRATSIVPGGGAGGEKPLLC